MPKLSLKQLSIVSTVGGLAGVIFGLAVHDYALLVASVIALVYLNGLILWLARRTRRRGGE